MSDLIHSQNVVERMLTVRRPLAEIEDYIEDCVLDEIEKAGLWMLAWAHQGPGHTTTTCQRNARARNKDAHHDCLEHQRS